MIVELQSEEITLIMKMFIWTAVLGNFMFVFLLLRQRKIPAAGYIIQLSVCDAVLLTFLSLIKQRLLSDVIHGLVVTATVQSNICKLTALNIIDKTILESLVTGFSRPKKRDVPGKSVLLLFTICAVAPSAMLLYTSLNFELEHEWRLLVQLLEILLLHVLPLPAMGYLVVRITRQLKMVQSSSEDVSRRHNLLVEGHQSVKHFTHVVVYITLVSFITYPMFSALLMADYVFPYLTGSARHKAVTWVLIAQCGMNVFIYIFTRSRYPSLTNWSPEKTSLTRKTSYTETNPSLLL